MMDYLVWIVPLYILCMCVLLSDLPLRNTPCQRKPVPLKRNVYHNTCDAVLRVQFCSLRTATQTIAQFSLLLITGWLLASQGRICCGRDIHTQHRVLGESSLITFCVYLVLVSLARSGTIRLCVNLICWPS